MPLAELNIYLCIYVYTVCISFIKQWALYIV